MLEEVDWGMGKITYNDFELDKKKPIKEQIAFLKEDLFQVEYSGGYIIDIGWYPSFSSDGSFQIILIAECDWTNPIHIERCHDIETLNAKASECVMIVAEKTREKNNDWT